MKQMTPVGGSDWAYDAMTGAMLQTRKGIEWLYDAAMHAWSPTAVAPAPEEYRTLDEFKAACTPNFKACEAVWKHFNTGPHKTLTRYYQACWAEPEAESIHAAWVAQRI